MLGVQSQILVWLKNPLLIYVIQVIGSWLIDNILDLLFSNTKGEDLMKNMLIIIALLATLWACQLTPEIVGMETSSVNQRRE